MRRLHLLTAALALVFVACASEGGAASTATSEGFRPPTSQPSPSGSGESPDTAEEPASITTTTTAPETTETTSGRPSAPDFSLELGEGGTYTLSEGVKPVYLVFWAEW